MPIQNIYIHFFSDILLSLLKWGCFNGLRSFVKFFKLLSGAMVVNTIDNVDRKLIENLANLMSSEVRAKIYIYLRKYDRSTVDDIADGTGIYPSTVRESILEMYNTGYVSREKMDKEGLGKKPYLYSAAAPSEIVKKISKSIQEKLNDLIMVDKKLESKEYKLPFLPVKIVVDEKYKD